MPEPIPVAPTDDADQTNVVAQQLAEQTGLLPSAALSLTGTVSGIGDWYIHTQDIEGMYETRQWNKDCDATVGTTPSVEFNYKQVRAYVTTSDKVLRNVYFSSVTQEAQVMEILGSGCSSVTGSTTLSGGFQTKGRFFTTRMGTITRPARKNAAGALLDPSGTCTEWFNVDIAHAPDAHSCDSGYDTFKTRPNDMGQILQEAAKQCPTFDPALVTY